MENILGHTDNTRYLTLEIARLEKLLWNWLQLEKQRPPFKIVALEKALTVTLGPVTANFRIDRIDELLQETTETKQLIIDYKTGKELNRSDWFSARLNEPQLPIYCIANPEETLGIAFGSVHPSSLKMMGVSKAPVNMNEIDLLSAVKQADATLWSEQIRIWQQNLTHLADDFHSGKAHVDPKKNELTCRRCGLQSLCRIHELTEFYDDNYSTSSS